MGYQSPLAAAYLQAEAAATIRDDTITLDGR